MWIPLLPASSSLVEQGMVEFLALVDLPASSGHQLFTDEGEN